MPGALHCSPCSPLLAGTFRQAGRGRSRITRLAAGKRGWGGGAQGCASSGQAGRRALAWWQMWVHRRLLQPRGALLGRVQRAGARRVGQLQRLELTCRRVHLLRGQMCPVIIASGAGVRLYLSLEWKQGSPAHPSATPV